MSGWNLNNPLKALSSGLLEFPSLSGGAELFARDMGNLSDDELIALTLSGRRKAFESIVRRYQKLVYNVIFQMIQNHESAADLTQETFLRAYRGLAGFYGKSHFKPWLLKIASNTTINQIRSSRSKYQQSLDELLEDTPQSEPRSAISVEEEVELNLSQSSLQKVLCKLSTRQRHVFLLRYQHDLPYADIALITEESEATIKSLLFRAREKLRKLLSEGQSCID